jgi:hypothetical protein
MPLSPDRRWRRRSLLAAGLASLAPASCVLGGPASPADLAPARPLAIDPLPPGGPLTLLGGLQLDDEAIGFGGLSALHLDAELRITAISDLAFWMTARLELQDGRPVGLSDLWTGPLRDGAGRPLRRGYAGDAESLARLPDGGWLVGFERWHRIRAYRQLSGPGVYVEPPPGLQRASTNSGLESLAVLADGRWLAIAEALPMEDVEGATQAWLGGPGRWMALAYRPAEGFYPADAAPLPDGGALVLERSFSILGGFGGRLVRLSAAALREAATTTVLQGEEILRIAAPLPVDNFEGVSAARVGERTLVALVSDDNQFPLQRSLLLLFALNEG